MKRQTVVNRCQFLDCTLHETGGAVWVCAPKGFFLYRTGFHATDSYPQYEGQPASEIWRLIHKDLWRGTIPCQIKDCEYCQGQFCDNPK